MEIIEQNNLKKQAKPSYQNDTIACAISHAWLNKTPLQGYSKAQAESFSFVSGHRTLEALADHILEGGKFAHSSFTQQRKCGHCWASSQMIVLDFDGGVSVARLLTLSMVREQAWLIYATPSSTAENPRTRLVYVLDRPITDTKQWIRLARGSYEYFATQFAELPNLKMDTASYSIAHSWAGSTNRIEQPYVNHAARLPVALIPEYNEPKPVPMVVGQGEIANDVITAIERTLGITRYKSDGWSLPIACPFKKHEHDDTNPASAWHKDKHIHYCQKCQQTRLAKETAAVLGIEWPKQLTPRPKRSVQHRAEKQQVQDTRKSVQYISDDLPPAAIEKYRTLLIQGGTGLGKSRAVGDYANTLPNTAKITFMAQFRLLIQGVRKYIHDADHYEDAAPNYQSMLGVAARLLTSVSSSPKFDRNNSDLLMVDEVAGVLNFVVNSDTFKHDESVIAYRTLKHWVSSAVQLIGMDANLSSIEIDWINHLRGNDSIIKSYRRHDTRGIVTLLRDYDTATWQIKKLLTHRKGQVYVASSSEKKATALHNLFSGGDYRVFKITRDTSNTPEVARFIADPEYRAQFDLVIYDPAMGSGVDISEPVYALVGVFDRTPLAPESAIQLFGRVRNAQRYYATVPAESDGFETPTADELKAARLKQEYWTAKRSGHAPVTNGDYLEMLDLWSKYQERHLREVARWRHYFAERLKCNGFSVQWHNTGVSKPLRAAFKAWRDHRTEKDWEFTLGATGLALVDSAVEEMRLNRQEITQEIRLYNTRYKIEKVLGSDAVSEYDADLMSQRKRDVLYRAIQRRNEDSLAMDAAESAEGVPLQKRNYSHAELTIISSLLTKIGFDGSPAQQDKAFLEFFLTEHSKFELEETFPFLMSDECTKLFKMLGHLNENANTVLGRIKWLLDYLWGVRPVSERRGRGENRYMVYWMESTTVTYLLARRERAATAQKGKLAQNVYHESINKNLNRFVVHHHENQQSTLKVVKIGTGVSKINPFSQPVTAIQAVV